ncbi:F-box protein At3g58530 isoform X2 [Syzygium oleosum]|uniref:F-box protein At3g58530 isoform X2 n=1 Tax=Syzygium oleosum TaxID=219896 RepID=UPI0024BBE4A7|nr:F-box protein At3g58530 isoform X2 [Syzygium oleosum]
MEAGAEAELAWSRETIPRVAKIVCARLPQRDLVALLLASPWLHRTLASYPSLWLVLDLREMTGAGNRLLDALSLPRYRQVKRINLEFAQDIEDKHLESLKNKYSESLKSLETLNLNGCQKISDKGIAAVTSCCPNLKVLSIYWNVRVTDIGIKHLVESCRHLVDLNLSGCKQILSKCSSLQSLNLYALSSLTDNAYNNISSLSHLNYLDLCGAQNLSDDALSCIAKCRKLAALNLTWCVRITDKGVKTVAEGCVSLEFLSLFGIVGVTDKCLEALSTTCSHTLATLDVNGCVGIKRRSREDLLELFPHLNCFKVHS